MKITDAKTAIEIFIDSSIVHGKASEEGNYKLGNKNYDKIVDAVKYLKENNLECELTALLNNENVSVQLWAATCLLEKNEDKAKEVLSTITKKNIPHYSFTAQLTLEEWNSGNLKLQY